MPKTFIGSCRIRFSVFIIATLFTLSQLTCASNASAIVRSGTSVRPLVPLRFIAEELQAQVQWNNMDRTVTIYSEN